ncbi:MAG: hypothetical protein RQ864_04400 [Lutibacter sp.]|nr:hypothetical protein [Lutibacter sp.]
MKTLLKIFFLMAVISLVAGCNKDVLFDEQSTDPQLKKAHVEETVPFKADFTVWDQSDYTDVTCGGYPVFRLTMIGEGVATHLGKLSTSFTFCCNVKTGEYYNTDVVFTAANGDELYASIPIGQILPNEGDNSDYYQTYFNDKMEFTGGTGRFKGASGEAMSNAFVHDDPVPENWHTDFFCTGTLTLVEGKK